MRLFLVQVILFEFLRIATSQNYPVLKDKSTAKISLFNFNVSNPSGESVEFLYYIEPLSFVTIEITNIPGDAYFIVVQAHSYLNNITLSIEKVNTISNSIQGTNIGLWKSSLTSTDFMYLKYSNNATTMVMIAVQAYGNQTPVPGGCNLEYSVEVTPYLTTKYNDSIIQVDFAAAAPPISLTSWLGISSQKSCNLKPPAVEHIMYRFYIPERNFEPEMYFSALSKAMTQGRIQANAWAVPEKIGGLILRRIFAAYPGTGSVFVVVANSLTHSVVYVPSFTYACDPSTEDDTCAVLNTTFSKILCALIFFLGLFACFSSHYFFKAETFLFGFLIGSLITYTVLVKISLEMQYDNLLYSVLGGIATGFFCNIVWCIFGMPILSVTLACCVLGYFIAASFFFAVLDLGDVFTSDVNFWLTYCAIILLIPALFLSASEKANILATSVLGAYAILVPVDFYLGSNIRYILINSIRRATVYRFKWAVIDPPIQESDIILAVAWVILAAIGFYTQIRLIRSRPPFPPPVNFRRLYRRIRGPQILSERTPLLTAEPSAPPLYPTL